MPETEEPASANPDPAGTAVLALENAASHGPLLRAEVSVAWPSEPLPELALPAAQLIEQLGALWPLLADSETAHGPGCLWGLRWDEHEHWQLLIVPPHGAELPVPATPGAREHDAWVVASALIEIAVGRAPRDQADAFDLLDLHAGVVHGLDAIVHTLLTGGNPAQVHHLLRPPPPGRVQALAAAETAVGSGKARYNPEFDNEDSHLVLPLPDGALALAVCDGVTGPGDGSGALASRAAVRELRTVLAGDGDIRLALTTADRAVQKETTGASTALVATITRDGVADLYSIGDSPAWLVRRRKRGGRVAFRLTPEQTLLAETRRIDPDAVAGGSQLVQSLGGDADQPYRSTVRVVPGDLLVLLSDGASVRDQVWFGFELAALADAFPKAPALAAALMARAERLGGHDNATAVIAEIHPTP
ncbi:hypothetical protein GCM10022221_64370 [Actinocorallia aurea]